MELFFQVFRMLIFYSLPCQAFEFIMFVDVAIRNLFLLSILLSLIINPFLLSHYINIRHSQTHLQSNVVLFFQLFRSLLLAENLLGCAIVLARLLYTAIIHLVGLR